MRKYLAMLLCAAMLATSALAPTSTLVTAAAEDTTISQDVGSSSEPEVTDPGDGSETPSEGEDETTDPAEGEDKQDPDEGDTDPSEGDKDPSEEEENPENPDETDPDETDPDAPDEDDPDASLPDEMAPANAPARAAAQTYSNAPLQNLTINGNHISEYIIVRPASGFETSFRPEVQSDYERGIGNEIGEETLQPLMEQFTGYRLDVGYSTPDDVKDWHDPEKVIWLTFNKDLDPNGFRVTVSGAKVTIEGGVGSGLWYGMYDFLETCLGVRFISQDNIYCPSGDVNVTDISYTEHESPFELRDMASFYSGNNTTKNNLARKLNSGSNNKYPMNNVKYGWTVGTTWYNAHSFQYQIPSGTQGSTWDTQPCLSKEETFVYVRDAVCQLIEERLAQGQIIGKTMTLITVGWNDNTNYCSCADCIAARTGDENLSDQYIRFVNRVAEVVEEKYPGMRVMALAYDDTREPPKVAVPRDNVVVMYCSGACNNHGIAHANECSDLGIALPGRYTQSRLDKSNLQKWINISETVYYWGYWDAFGNFVAQSPIWSYIKDDIRLLADMGVKGIYSEGRSNPDEQFCFEMMRDYLISNLMWDPYMSDAEYERLTREFMDIYYGAGAGKYMYELMKIWDKGGSEGCFINNFSSVKAVHDLNYYGKNYDKICELFDAAEAVSYGEYLERIQLVRCGMEFLGLSGLWEDRYVNGSAAEKEWYIDKYTDLWNAFEVAGITHLDDYSYLGSFDEFANYHSTETDKENPVDLSYCPLSWYQFRDGFHDVDPRYYTVEFHTNGGTAVAGQKIFNFWCSQPEETTREHYVFDGWYTTPECEGDAYIFGYRTKRESMIGYNDCDENGVFHLYAKWVPDSENPDPEQNRLVLGSVAVPDALKANEALNTVEKIEAALQSEMTKADAAANEENTAFFDVTMQVKKANGNWANATAEDFLAMDSVEVTLTYEEISEILGVEVDNTYEYTLIHMFSMDIEDRCKAGETEVIRPADINKGLTGITFHVKGLSSFAIIAKKIVEEEKPTTPTNPGNQGGNNSSWSSSSNDSSSSTSNPVTIVRIDNGKKKEESSSVEIADEKTPLTANPSTGAL